MADTPRNDNTQWLRALFHTLALLTPATAIAMVSSNQAIDKQRKEDYNNKMRDWIKQNYPEFSDTTVNGLISKYGDTNDAEWWNIWSTGKDSSQWDELKEELDKIRQVHEDLGDMPLAPSTEDLDNLQNEAYAQIDAENQQLLDLYNESFQNSENMLRSNLAENSAMFGDYRNQILTNEAMRQQAIAGSTRYELDRQQRNAITRGASAAQRLVANINTQLGLQAQSAQQSLDTSNALAQNLLAHRQAQQDIRNSYLAAQNQHNRDVASTISGQTERKFNYGQSRKQDALDTYDRTYGAYNSDLDDRFQGDSIGRNIYTSTYGNRRNNKNGI